MPLARQSVFSRLRVFVALSVTLLIATSWLSPGQVPSAAAGRSARPAAPSAGLQSPRPSIHLRSRQTFAAPPCLAPAPTPVVTASPTATASPTPTSTPTATPTGVAGQALPPINCIVSAAPAKAYNALGYPHTVTFLCGAAAASLSPPPGLTGAVAGCYDLSATVTDIVSGSQISFSHAECGGAPAPTLGTVNCASTQNPICPAGYRPVTPTTAAPGATCSPCPPGFTLTPTSSGNLCIGPPTTTGGPCPEGSTIFVANSGGTPALCEAPFLSTESTPGNELTLTINPGAPHTYLFHISGYVGTIRGDGCPAGTTLAQNVNLSPPVPGTPAVFGPACFFSLEVEKKYVEANSIQILPQGPCGTSVAPGYLGAQGDTPCLFLVKATGMIVLKTGISCSAPGEPATGTSAVPDGFPLGTVYDCTNGSLAVQNVPVPHVVINLTAQNGFFAPNCFPAARFPVPTPTATATLGLIVPTPTFTPEPTFTPTPTASITPGAGAGFPTPPPAGTGVSTPAFCGPPGVPFTSAVTDQNGIAIEVGQEVEFDAAATPPFPPPGGNVTITGHFFLDGVPISGVPMFTTWQEPSGSSVCDSGVTDASGTATCTKNIDATPPGATVTVTVDFIYNCTDYSTVTSFTVSGSTTPLPTVAPVVLQRAPAPNGICVMRQTAGPLIITGTFVPTVNTQPGVTTGPVILGEFGIATSTPTAPPAATVVPTAAPTSTLISTPTMTPVPTQVATLPQPPPTATVPPATPTPTPTATPGPLNFTLDAARVSNPCKQCHRQGVDSVHRGQHLWLMMYFTVHSIPRKLTRATTYEVRLGGRTVFRVVFKQSVGTNYLGSFIRYSDYFVPKNATYGVYVYRGTLGFDGRSKTRTWSFAVVRTASVAPHLLLSRE